MKYLKTLSQLNENFSEEKLFKLYGYYDGEPEELNYSKDKFTPYEIDFIKKFYKELNVIETFPYTILIHDGVYIDGEHHMMSIIIKKLEDEYYYIRYSDIDLYLIVDALDGIKQVFNIITKEKYEFISIYNMNGNYEFSEFK